MVLVMMRCVCHQHRWNLTLKAMDLLPRPQQHQQQLGYVILHRDWDYHHRDLDIVAIDNGVLVIVEVKTRKNEQFADADEAVTVQKVRSLSIAANAYVKRYNINLDIRFDIITVVGQPTGTNEVRHVKDAFLPFI